MMRWKAAGALLLLATTVTAHAGGQCTNLCEKINQERNERRAADCEIHGRIDKEADARGKADGELSDRINLEGDARKQGDLNLAMQNNALQDQINETWETKYVLDGAVRLYDGKKIQVQAFDAYDVRHKRNFQAGVRVVYKLGKSYEEKILEKQAFQIELLQAQINQMNRGGRANITLE